jgi:hypothetical protein
VTPVNKGFFKEFKDIVEDPVENSTVETKRNDLRSIKGFEGPRKRVNTLEKDSNYFLKK